MKVLGMHIAPHDGGFVIIENNKVKHLLEVERLFKIKTFEDVNWTPERLRIFVDYITSIDNNFDVLCVSPEHEKSKSKCKASKVAILPILELFDECIKNSKIRYKKLVFYSHHLTHAASSYYTSSFNDSLIISLDGGGDSRADTHFGEMFYSKDNNIKSIRKISIPFGKHYREMGRKILKYAYQVDNQLKSFTINDDKDGVAGRFMAFCSLGEYDKSYLDLIKDVLNKPSYIGDNLFLSLLGRRNTELYKLDFNNINLKNFSYTFQHEWIKKILDEIKEYSHLSDNICVSGGCFLNVVLNKKLMQSGLFKNYHFIPHTNDAGHNFGAATNYLKTKIDLSLYPEPKAFDYEKLNEFNKNNKKEKLNYKTLVDLLIKQKIIGVFRDNMEFGPRALGNRSILADPRKIEMKDILNSKVKNREWYRPFGIIILEEELENYYDIKGSFPFMNIVGDNKTEDLKAVKHYDNSTRIQTVTYEQNPFIYSLIKEFQKKTGVPALINTSFNVNGQPIINWYEDAFIMLNKNKLDALVIEDNIYY